MKAQLLRHLKARWVGAGWPSWCTFLVTKRCNARCRMCDSWRMPPSRELNPEEIYRIFSAVGPLDVVRLSGGEPFLRTDLLEVAVAVEKASRPLVLHITTNGSFPERVEQLARRFPRPKALHFLVSVEGLAAEHDANRGRQVTFAQVEETVRRLVQLRPSHGVKVAVNLTLSSPRALVQAEEVYRHFGRLGVEVNTVVAYAASATYTLGFSHLPADQAAGYPLAPSLGTREVRAFVSQELTRAGSHRAYSWRLWRRYYLQGLLSRLEGELSPYPRPRCTALRYHLRINPDGSVPICQFNGSLLGNLLEIPFRQLWSSPRAEAARQWVDRCPGCWAECEAFPNALYSGDLLRWRWLWPALKRGVGRKPGGIAGHMG
ncbi:MAG: radical SAM protein [Thermoanaerobaculum sp.]|nr:radical SAM protein [Thermoanaerobaculum sp.]MDW7966805.1 radical SAM protein [Thermoanaerobaculum sp.]